MTNTPKENTPKRFSKRATIGVGIGASLCGLVLGVAAVRGCGSVVTDDVNEARMVDLGWGKPNALVVKRDPMSTEEVLVDVGGNTFVPYKQYLRSIAHPKKREAMRQRIYEAAEWEYEPKN